MAYKEYALRAPSVQAAIDSAKPALVNAGLDPYALDVLSQTEEGSDVLTGEKHPARKANPGTY
jgi:hypothetical protein